MLTLTRQRFNRSRSATGSVLPSARIRTPEIKVSGEFRAPFLGVQDRRFHRQKAPGISGKHRTMKYEQVFEPSSGQSPSAIPAARRRGDVHSDNLWVSLFAAMAGEASRHRWRAGLSQGRAVSHLFDARPRCVGGCPDRCSAPLDLSLCSGHLSHGHASPELAAA